MINQNFMRALAKLESVSATEREKAIINSVRGLYVDRYGRDNQFVSTLAQLESVAVTSREKAEINTIRGKFGLMEMTYGLGVDPHPYKKRIKGMSTSAEDEVAPINDPDTGLPMTDDMVDDQYNAALAAQDSAELAGQFQDTLDDIAVGNNEDDWSDLFR
jgi:hypothetical protein